MKAKFKIGDNVLFSGQLALVASVLEPDPIFPVFNRFRYAITFQDNRREYWIDEEDLTIYSPVSLSQGRKDDAGKPAMHLLPWDAVDAAAAVMTYGAERYGERNWEDAALSQERILAGAVRHISQHLQNKKVDESGKMHLAHAAASLLMALAKELRNV